MLLALCAPVGGIASQEVPQLTRDELTVFASAHVAMNVARDEFHAEIGRAHEEPARERARAAFEERVAAILQTHELTQEEYDRRVLIVSLDADMRAALDEILAELAAEGSPGND